jgi:hypothetical protein
MGLTLHRNVPRWAPIAVVLVSLTLHRRALCKSLAWLSFHAELSV